MKKLYYYSFSFVGNGSPGETQYSSIYIGYKKKGVTKPQIEQAKIDSESDKEAVLLSCCYLGRMTLDTMTDGHNTDH